MNNKTKYQHVELQDSRGRNHDIAVQPVTYQNQQTPAGVVSVPVMPAWVKQVQFKNWSVAMDLVVRDIVSHFAAVQSDKVRAYCAPLRVSDTVHPGFFWLDDQGLITVNERWAKDRALDSDGDNAFLVYTSDRQAAYFVKYPLTQVVPLLYRQQDKEPDTWEDYDESLECWKEPCSPTEQEIREGFLKVHEAGMIGPKTNAWDARELYQAYSAQMTYLETAQHLLSDIGRFYDLEGDLKKSRAGLGAKTPVSGSVIGNERYIVEDRGRWRLQGKVGTVDPRILASYLLATNWEHESRAEDLLAGLSFKKIKTVRPLQPREEPVKPRYSQIEAGWKKRNFTQRLEALGVLEWQELEHVDKSLPPAQILRVYYRKGPKEKAHPVALHDERREGSMHQEWFLPPVCVVKDGRPLWFKARDMLEDEIAGIQTKQRGGDLWPQKYGELSSRPNRSAQLQQALQRFVGKYGLPSLVSNEFETRGKQLSQRMFTVEYGTNLPEKMWERVQCLRQWFRDNSSYAPGILGSVKNSDKSYRRYLIADPRTLVPALVPLSNMKSLNRCSAKRVGELHSQLAQSIPLGQTSDQNMAEKLVPMRDERGWLVMEEGCDACRLKRETVVLPKDQWQIRRARLFIYGGDGTMGQLYAFPSGQALQKVPGVFLPQVNDQPDEDYGVTTPRTYVTLSGEEKVSYTSAARPTIGVGKLISVYGMKNYCGVETEQLKALTSRGMVDVDFAINQRELMSTTIVDEEGREWKGKGCLEAMLENGRAQRASVVWNGRRVHGRLVEVVLNRTTTASENTQPETRVRNVSGIAKHAVRAAMMRDLAHYGTIQTNDWLNWDERAIALADQPRIRQRDLRYLKNLQHAARVIGSRFGRCSPPQPLVELQAWYQEIGMMEDQTSEESHDQVTDPNPSV